jgi:hypothetical protein
MAIDIKVPCCFRQLKFNSFQLLVQNNLTAKSRVLFEIRSHVQQVLFLLLGFGKLVEIVIEDVNVASCAGKRCFAGSFHFDSVTMRQVQNVIADFSFHWVRLSGFVEVRYVHTESKVEYEKKFRTKASTYISSSDFGSCHS